MIFHEKLDFLMNLAGVANSKIAKESNLDPSLISRWRRGIKTPALNSDSLHCLAKALASRISIDFRREKFAETSGVDVETLSGASDVVGAIQQWFAEGQPEDGSDNARKLRLKPYPNYNDRQQSSLDALSLAESYCAGKEGRIMALQWITSFVKHWQSGGTLRFYNDQSPGWFEVDHDFFREVFERDTQLIRKFDIVKILQPLISPDENHLLIFEFAKLFMETATVSITFEHQQERSAFQHSIGIYDNNVAITCYGFYGSNYIPTQLHSDERFVHDLVIDFETHFESADIALRSVPKYSVLDSCRFFSAFFMQHEDIYYRSSQVFLPFLPAQLLCEVLSDSEVGRDRSGGAYAKIGEQMVDFLKHNRLFVTISSKPFYCLQENRADSPNLYIRSDRKFCFTREQCLAILENTLLVFEQHENLFLFIEDEQINDFALVQEKQKLFYARINEKFHPYQSYHPHMVRIVCRDFADKTYPLLKRYDRAAVSDKLCDIISSLNSAVHFPDYARLAAQRLNYLASII